MSPVVSPEIVEILLTYGANPNVKSKTQETPLHYACQKGNVQKVVLLLKFGANVNSANKHGFSPFDACVIKSCCTTEVKLLILKCFMLAGLKVDSALRQSLFRYREHFDPLEYSLIDSHITVALNTPLSLLNTCRICIRRFMNLPSPKVFAALSEELPSSICGFLQFADLFALKEKQ